MPDTIKVPILLGADPEMFVRDRKTKKFVSAHTMVPGTKLAPFKVPQGATQYDGVAAEFNIDPSRTSTEFVGNIHSVINTIKTQIGKDNELVLEPTATFDPEYFDNLPPDVRELGCNPDFNAYTGDQNPSPDTSPDPYMRTASGHIHVGWSAKDQEFDPNDPAHQGDCHMVAKQMDYALGVMSLLWDPDPKRRTLYGKAGCLRYKKYGMEYRTMSNRWLSSPDLEVYVFANAHKAMTDLFSGVNYSEMFGDAAKKIIDENIIDWPHRKEFVAISRNVRMPPVVLTAPKKENPRFFVSKKRSNPPPLGQSSTLLLDNVVQMLAMDGGQ